MGGTFRSQPIHPHPNPHHPRIVSRDEWLASRKQHLQKEKELTRLRGQLSAERRNLPWVKVEKRYVFDGSIGKQTLADLFDGRSQLVVKHFMLGPGWKEGCVGCSFEVDHIEGALVHLEHHDVSVVAVSHAGEVAEKAGGSLVQCQRHGSRPAWPGLNSGAVMRDPRCRKIRLGRPSNPKYSSSPRLWAGGADSAGYFLIRLR
jgi:hypothetical protein